MAHNGPVLNPISHLDRVGPQEKPISREQRRIQRRVAKFEASRAQEEAMPPKSPFAVQEMNPVEHQKTMSFTPKPSVTPPIPQGTPPNRSQVQRIAKTAPAPMESEGPDLRAELEAELNQPAPQESAPPVASPPTTEGTDDIENILKRYKGSPDEVARQLAKSFKEAEKRMRHLENEKAMLLKQPQTAAPTQPAAPPVMAQTVTTPQFKYSRWKDEVLDRGDEVAKEFEQHITSTLEQKLAQVAAPLYEEAIEGRLYRKFPDVVTEENLDIIKAMAQTEPGANRWEQIVSAVKKYKANMPTASPSMTQDEVKAMQAAVQTPMPQARVTGDKKMWKESDVQKFLQQKIRSGEYTRDPALRQLVDTAYREGRVIRGQ